MFSKKAFQERIELHLDFTAKCFTKAISLQFPQDYTFNLLKRPKSSILMSKQD